MSNTPLGTKETLSKLVEKLIANPTTPVEDITLQLADLLRSFSATPKYAGLKYNLQPGDRALYLQASCLEEMVALKKSLSEFNYANYENSAIYEKARAAEPVFFFPRIFCIEILANPETDGIRARDKWLLANLPGTHPDKPVVDGYLRGHSPGGCYYFGKVIGELPTIDYYPIKCHKSAIFVSEEDMAELRSIYKKNIADSEAWLDEVQVVKTFELQRKFTRLRDNMAQESQDSWAAFDTYGLNGDVMDCETPDVTTSPAITTEEPAL